MARASSTERELARIYYVRQQMTAKDIADLLNRKPGTIGKWAKDGGWKKAREAFLFSSKEQIDNIKEIIGESAKQHIELIGEMREAKAAKDFQLVQELRKQMVVLADNVSKWNKSLTNLEESNRVTLSQYVAIHEEIFDFLRSRNPKIYKEYVHDLGVQLLQSTIKKYE